jgi:hypothetical protein
LWYLIEKEVFGADVLFKKMVIKVPDLFHRTIETEDERKNALKELLGHTSVDLTRRYTT